MLNKTQHTAFSSYCCRYKSLRFFDWPREPFWWANYRLSVSIKITHLHRQVTVVFIRGSLCGLQYLAFVNKKWPADLYIGKFYSFCNKMSNGQHIDLYCFWNSAVVFLIFTVPFCFGFLLLKWFIIITKDT